MIVIEITPLQAIAFCQWSNNIAKSITQGNSSDPVSKEKAITCIRSIENQIKEHMLKETTVGSFAGSGAALINDK